MVNSYRANTLRYDPSLCEGCGLCGAVCPHRVFEIDGGVASLAHPELCIECGACQRNCAQGAIQVRSGVGCAVALIGAALFGGEAACCSGGEAGSGDPTSGASRCCRPPSNANPSGGESNGEGQCA